jgi:hypothetical protein
LAVADFLVILSYYNATACIDDKPGNPKSDGITTVKVWHPGVFEDIVLEGPPKRTVFRRWPQSPSCKLVPNEPNYCGKATPNGLPWGATIFDFYYARQCPPISMAWNVYTGSQLLEWSKANGEDDWAKDEIEWARREEEPHVLEPCAPGTFLENQEENIRARREGWGTSMPKDVGLNTIDIAADNVRVHFLYSYTSLNFFPQSIFHPSNYPSPWPLVSFSYPTERLQTRIPLHQLPKKITVHDPWNLLAMDSLNCYGRGYAQAKVDEANWLEKPDIVHTYSLQLSPAGEARLQEEMLEAKSKRDTLAAPQNPETKGGPDGLHGYFLHAHSDTPPGPIAPPIFVIYDPPPTLHPNDLADATETPKRTRDDGAIDEAHLYLSPACRIGKGNHSIVYQGEWELPRTTFLPPSTSPVLCKECVDADVKNILLEEDGVDGERMEGRWKEKSAVLRRVVDETRPSIDVRFAYDGSPDVHESKVTGNVYTVNPQQTTYQVKLEGPIRPIRTKVEWQDPSKPTCQHLLSRLPIPPTAKFRVVAKLSLCYDRHLEREARNYQDFDQHMFEHWSGLNKVDPLHDLCSVGALVPQFYGYYVPQLKEDEEEGCVHFMVPGVKSDTGVEGVEGKTKIIRGYLSPILLLEDCGKCIFPVEDLSADEK